MPDIDSVIAKLLRAEELDIHQGEVQDSEITQLSKKYDVILPADYTHFLRKCGFASWLGHGVYGIFDPADERFPPSYNFSADEQTHRARAMHSHDPYPFCDSSIVIGKDDMGGYFLLISEGAAPNRVVWVNTDETWGITRTWESFSEFLDFQLTQPAG